MFCCTFYDQEPFSIFHWAVAIGEADGLDVDVDDLNVTGVETTGCDIDLDGLNELSVTGLVGLAVTGLEKADNNADSVDFDELLECAVAGLTELVGLFVAGFETFDLVEVDDVVVDSDDLIEIAAAG